ncbi:sensor histidine kinase [Streptomyces sp. NPDC059009]|uniref:sensor histidine kinase n=1 Tax=Streptomyces sp. NPDC059009 TaxID=3346694 RepID=UPI0036B80784
MKSPRLADALLWAALAAPALSVDRLGFNEPTGPAQQLTSLTALALACATRRRRPLLAFLLAAGLGLTAGPSLFSLSYGAALAVFAFQLGRRARRERPALLAFGAVALVGTAKIVVRDVDPVVEWLVLMGTLLFGAVFPWLAGRYGRQSRELTTAALARAEQLEQEQRIVADRARLRERARIAQDMHDSLGHELSLIAVRAGALQVAPDLPDRHRDAAADLRVAASDATDRLHQIIGLLREEDDEPAPLAPPGETVEALVARAAESGLDVRYVGGEGGGEETGDEAGDEVGDVGARELTRGDRMAGRRRMVHRVVQEALTNAAKHAPGAPVEVRVDHEPSAALVTVTNERPQQPGSAAGGGSGLAGLRDRLAALGGSLDAGPHGDGGFRIRARVPAGGAPRVPEELRGAPGTVLALARRRTALAFGAAVGTGVLLVGGAFGWYAYSRSHSVLDPDDYARLHLGAALTDVQPLLPDRAEDDPPTDRAPRAPAGADCRYYRASGQLFTTVAHFRLCFAGAGPDGPRLVAKSVIPKAGTGQEVQEEEKEWMR